MIAQSRCFGTAEIPICESRSVYHFIGLGGIGMSALARVLLQRGSSVQGSDLKSSSLLKELEKEGAKVQIGHKKESLSSIKTVVYSTGIKEDNVELREAKRQNLPMLHRSELLDKLMEGKKSLLVTGTHGKTTTSSLLAHVLVLAKLDPSFVVGGLIRSLNTNGKAGNGQYFVAEADESDGSFLKTNADAAIITNLADEHLGFWGSSRILDLAFQQFINQTKDLFWCYDNERLRSLKTKGISYGFSAQADFQIKNYRQVDSGIIFDLGIFRQIELSLFGRHNAENGAAVFALALHLKIPEEVIRLAFKTFSGTARRLEFKGEKRKVRGFDDYGHHPREIQTTIQALRDHIREKRLVCVFQPHRYSRVKDLFDAFIPCFDAVDQLFITDIYAAGETPIQGLSEALYEHLKIRLGSKVHYLPRTELESGVAKTLKPLDVVLTMGAGDVTDAVVPILNLYREREAKLKVGVLFGGTSAEHPVSLMSARKIAEALDRSVYDVEIFGITTTGRWCKGFDFESSSEDPLAPSVLRDLLECDVCIPVFHGPQGEDGMIGGVLDALNIPYAGCDYRSGAVCMQKVWTKQIVIHHNVPVVPYLEIKKVGFEKNVDLELIEAKFAYPIWVKPAHLGSSIAVSRAENREELLKFLELGFLYDHVLILEKHIEGRQIEFGLLGNEYIQKACPSEIINHGAFVAFDKKYGMTAMEIKAPADISLNEKAIGYELAETVYRALGCKGLARVDFFLDRQGYFWFNEINPFPGFTETSAFPIMWEQSGFNREKINDVLITLALQKERCLNEVRGKQ